MPDLRNTLYGADYQYLVHLAEKWGIPLDAADAHGALDRLVEEMTQPALVEEMVHALPIEAREGLEWLLDHQGRALWDSFTRQIGMVREMGSGKRERERPDLDPISPAEVLWYRGFISRGFFDAEDGSKEYVFIPEDLRSVIADEVLPSAEAGKPDTQVMLARKATPEEREEVHPATTEAVDHTCTLLAALRADVDPGVHFPEAHVAELDFYHCLLHSVGLIDKAQVPQPEKIRDFFDLSRGESLFHLWRGWRSSSTHDDLALTPGLQPEGTWDSKPLKVRNFIEGILTRLPTITWMSISSFVARVYQHHPNFLRSGGEFDSWYIRDEDTGEYLRGFAYWDHVEGAYLRYLLTGPLHWLGVLDLGTAADDAGDRWSAFRISDVGTSLLKGHVPDIPQSDPDPIQIRSKGLIRISKSVPRRVRYQVARFGTWKPLKKGEYVYSLTPQSLGRAKSQNLEIAHLMTLLEGHAEIVPPNVVQALQRWEKHGSQAVMKEETVLRVASPAILDAIQNSRARRFLGDKLGSTVVVIREGSEEKIAEVLVEMGFFAEFSGGDVD